MWMEPLNIGKVFKVAFNWSTKYSFNKLYSGAKRASPYLQSCKAVYINHYSRVQVALKPSLQSSVECRTAVET